MIVDILKELASVTAIQKAFYRLAPFADFDLKDNGDEYYQICITPLKDRTSEDLKVELKMHINDYNLRESIEEKTSVVRGLLYAQAFSKVSKVITE